MIRRDLNQEGSLRISRFQVGKDDKRTTVDNSVTSVIRGIYSVGGQYGDVIAVLRMAKDQGYLSDRLAIDPLPEPLRTYYRNEAEESAEADDMQTAPEQEDAAS